MKDNIYDLVVDRSLKRIEAVSDKLATNFKNVKPFDREPISKDEILSAYQGLETQDMEYLIAKHGVEKVNQFIYEMERDKRKRFDNLLGGIS